MGLPPLMAGCTGRKLYEVLPVEAAHQIIESADIALATGEAQTLEYAQITAGSRRDCEARIVSCGRHEILVMIRDITERKRSEKALRESEERYALAAQGANDGLWDWDLRANEIHFSDRWKGMLGYGDDEVGNRPEEWLNRIHRDDADRVRMEINAHLEGKGPHFQSEYRITCKDGSYRWMLSRGIALRDGQAIRTGWRGPRRTSPRQNASPNSSPGGVLRRPHKASKPRAVHGQAKSYGQRGERMGGVLPFYSSTSIASNSSMTAWAIWRETISS